MRKLKVVFAFIKFGMSEKIAFYRNIIDKMTDNAYFLKPEIDLAVLTAKVNKLEVEELAATTGDHTRIAVMRDTEDEADELFRLQGLYVDKIAKGSEAIILSSGYETSKQPVRGSNPPLTVEYGDKPGTLKVTCKAVPGAKSYIWQYAIGALPATEKGWIFAGSSTQVTFIIDDLESGSKCWVRVIAVTPAGMMPASDPIMKIVP
jgi:hypothetical protein